MQKTSNPLVSIIVPNYNRVKFLHSSTENILHQTYKNIEVIVMDGKSTDGSVEILKELAKKDNRLRYVSEKDKGEVDATNKGLDLAKGDIIGFKASDDYYVPDAVEQSIRFLLEHPEYDAVCGDGLFIDENGNETGYGLTTYRGKMGKKYIKRILRFRYGSPLCHSAFFGWKERVLSAGKFNPDFSVTPDLEFYLRFLNSGGRIGSLPRIQVKYTFHPDSGAVKYRKEVLEQNKKVRQIYNWTVFDELVRISLGAFVSYLSNPYRKPFLTKAKNVLSDFYKFKISGWLK